MFKCSNNSKKFSCLKLRFKRSKMSLPKSKRKLKTSKKNRTQISHANLSSYKRRPIRILICLRRWLTCRSTLTTFLISSSWLKGVKTKLRRSSKTAMSKSTSSRRSCHLKVLRGNLLKMKSQKLKSAYHKFLLSSQILTQFLTSKWTKTKSSLWRWNYLFRKWFARCQDSTRSRSYWNDKSRQGTLKNTAKNTKNKNKTSNRCSCITLRRFKTWSSITKSKRRK